METLNIRYQATVQALSTLSESLGLLQSVSNEKIQAALQDSVIKRFEYSMDTFWKYLKEYLEVIEKITVVVASPKAVFRACVDSKLITQEEFETFLSMVDSRNLTSHTYNRLLAERISALIPTYFEVMNNRISHLKPSKI